MTMDLSPESADATTSGASALESQKSRRSLLAAAAGALAGFAATMLGRPQSGQAAAGDPLILGAANSAGVTNTSVTTSSAGTALLVTQNGSGTALRGSAVGAGSIAGFF